MQEDEEEDPDDLPEHLRPSAPIDMSKVDMKNPESLLMQSKKGKTIMTFVTVSGKPTKDEAEDITKIWQTGLWNAQIQAERYKCYFDISSTKCLIFFQVHDRR